ncbi:MAG: SMI1/KNR4 family protein [Dokdonella sp.]
MSVLATEVCFSCYPTLFRRCRNMIRKIQPPFACWTLAIALLLLVLRMQSVSSAATVDIEPVVYGGHAVDLSILVGGHEQCTIKLKGADGTAAKNAPCRLSLSKADDSIVVAGNYSFENGTKGRYAIRKGRQTIDVVDFEPASRALTRPGAPFGPRVSEFMKSARLFASKYKLESFDMEGGKPASSAEIDRAQKRLGYALPPELVSLLTTIGEIRQGDNAMTSVAKITDSYATMRQDWGTDEADLTDSYSPTMLAFLKASTLLYTEVGDGLGGLLFRPPPTKACGDEGIYIWTTQEEGTRNLSMDGACPNFERVFRWLVDRFVIERLADEMQEKAGAVLIDSSSGVQHLALTIEDGEAFRVALNRTWGESPLEDAQSTGKQGPKK